MDQVTAISQEYEKIKEWLSQNPAEYERMKTELAEEIQKELNRERRELDRARRSLEREQKELQTKKKMYERQYESQKQLFQMKWKILEEELARVAKEKREIEQEKEAMLRTTTVNGGNQTGIFFVGVKNELTLKKRHRDLTKIFHPDNIAGDTGIIQEINREYEELKNMFT